MAVVYVYARHRRMLAGQPSMVEASSSIMLRSGSSKYQILVPILLVRQRALGNLDALGPQIFRGAIHLLGGTKS